LIFQRLPTGKTQVCAAGWKARLWKGKKMVDVSGCKL